MSSIREIAEQVVREWYTGPEDLRSTSLITAIEQALRNRDDRAAKIADLWANSKSCDIHESNPCCHVRLGARIAEKIRKED